MTTRMMLHSLQAWCEVRLAGVRWIRRLADGQTLHDLDTVTKAHAALWLQLDRERLERRRATERANRAEALCGTLSDSLATAERLLGVELPSFGGDS